MLAKYNGTCPVCGKFIVKNRSQVAPLKEKIKPVYGHSDCSCVGPEPCSDKPHDFKYVMMGDRAYRPGEVARKSRVWAHERCV